MSPHILHMLKGTCLLDAVHKSYNQSNNIYCFGLQHGKDGGQSVLTRLKCAAGLADLATKKYKSAAKYFLQASFDHCDFPEVISSSVY